MIKQGLQSTVEINGERVTKYINEYDTWDELVQPWKEFKVLEYISELSPYFPQNVIEKGPYIIEYDFTPGYCMTNLTKKYFDEIYKLYYILNVNGFNHGDPTWGNFIIDNEDHVHIIDFGQVYPTKYRELLISGKIVDKMDENGEIIWDFIPPIVSYTKMIFPVTREFYTEVENLLDGAEEDETHWVERYLQELKSKINNHEYVD